MTNTCNEHKRAPRAKTTESDTDSRTPKKRGRKPKGGKIVTVTTPEENIVVSTPNVILHLKCSSNDLKNNGLFSNKCYEYDNNDVSSNIDAYQFDEQVDNSLFESVTNTEPEGSAFNETKHSIQDVINQKLKQLAQELYII